MNDALDTCGLPEWAKEGEKVQRKGWKKRGVEVNDHDRMAGSQQQLALDTRLWTEHLSAECLIRAAIIKPPHSFRTVESAEVDGVTPPAIRQVSSDRHTNLWTGPQARCAHQTWGRSLAACACAPGTALPQQHPASVHAGGPHPAPAHRWEWRPRA
eukprot:1157491-Pelagomonas_calceolata.AAC.8